MTRRQRGFSLMELMLVLTVATVIAGVVARSYLAAHNNEEADRLFARTMQLKNAIETTYPEHDFTGLTETTMAASPSTPPEMVNGTTLLDPIAGAVTMVGTVEAGTTLANGTYQVNWPSMPKEQCYSFATRMEPFSERMIIAGGIVKDGFTAVAWNRSQAAANCAAAARVTFNIRFKQTEG